MRTTLLAALAVGAILTAGATFAEVIHFTAKLDGASETPPRETKGTGTAQVTLDTTTRVLSWTVDYSGLTGAATMAHFHGPAAPGKAAAVTVPLSGDLANPIKGSAAITDGQIGDLRGGLWYINIHTAKYPPGEIRGQVLEAK
ncbi:MAG: CHRD domain-containing protein [Pseudomonadota bacterium]|nr:CHRD domain-containing protein [Pseudomonadota bacterium]